MEDFRLVNPKHYDVNTVEELPGDKPWGLFDLDGTLTRPEGGLLMATFVQSVQIGSMQTREHLTKLFEAFRQGEIQYETFLDETSKGFAEWLHSTNMRDPEIRQVSDNFFREVGYLEVLPYARPMIKELSRVRCNTAMITGAPRVVADPYAAYVGIEHVFGMPAERGPDGRYTGRMFKELNTGLLVNKGAICRKISAKYATLFGAGNTQSDTCLMETAYLLGEKNPIDMRGFAFLMNTGQIGDPIVERFMKSVGHRHAEFAFHCIPQTPDVPKLIDYFRSLLRGTLIKNGYEEVVHEIEGTRPMTPEEKEDLEAKRRIDPDCWRLTAKNVA